MLQVQAEALNNGSAINGPPIHVVATTLEGTRSAIRAARQQAEATNSQVYVLARRGLPSSANYAQASTRLQAFANDIRALPEAASNRLDVLACASARASDLMALIPPDGMVIIGGRSGRWWLTSEQRLAGQFAGLGCRVLFVHAEADAAGSD